jgi:hypothetical protein
MYHLKLNVARQTSDIDAHLGTEKQEKKIGSRLEQQASLKTPT